MKISGQLVAEGRPPHHMVIVDPAGTVVGVARAFGSNRFLNGLLYGGRMPNGQLAGYIKNYDADTRYFLRAAGPDGVSTERIAIAPLSR